MQSSNLTPNEIGALIKESKKMPKEIAAHFEILGTAILYMNPIPYTRKLMHDLSLHHDLSTDTTCANTRIGTRWAKT
jgi:hypothetical protein